MSRRQFADRAACGQAGASHVVADGVGGGAVPNDRMVVWAFSVEWCVKRLWTSVPRAYVRVGVVIPCAVSGGVVVGSALSSVLG